MKEDKDMHEAICVYVSLGGFIEVTENFDTRKE